MHALRIEGAEARLERRGLATKLRRASVLLFFTPLLALATIVMLHLGSDLLPVALGWTMLASPVAATAAYLVEKLHRRRRGAVIVDAHAVAIASAHDRDEPLTREALLRVLASPAALAERRIGAALALTPERHAGAQESVLAAALACANPRLRIALEQVADGDFDEAALDEAIADEARSRLAS